MTFQLYNFTFSLYLLQAWFRFIKLRCFWKAVGPSTKIKKKGSEALGKKQWVQRWEEVPHTCIVSLPASQPLELHSKTLHRNWRAVSRILLLQKIFTLIEQCLWYLTEFLSCTLHFLIFSPCGQPLLFTDSTKPTYIKLWNNPHHALLLENSDFIYSEVAVQKNTRR